MNNASLVPGAVSGRALCLWGAPDGWADGWVQVPAGEALVVASSDFTIELSVRRGTGTYDYLLAMPGMVMFVDEYGRVRCHLGGPPEPPPYHDAWLSNRELVPGDRNNLALVRSGGNVTLYINGIEDSGVQFSAPLYPFPCMLWVGPIWRYFGTDRVLVDKLFIAATALAPAPEKPEESSGIYASIYIPESPTAGVCDVIRYFHGDRDAGPADPAFVEAEGEPGSLLFRGAFLGLEMTIAIAPSTFSGLTANVDSLQATTTATYTDGASMTLRGTFTETETGSGLFRSARPQTGSAGTYRGGRFSFPFEWCAGMPDNRVGNTVQSYAPFMPRIKGIPANAVALGYKLVILGTECDLEAHDDCFYVRSESRMAAIYVKLAEGGGALLFQAAGHPLAKEGNFAPGQGLPGVDIKLGERPPLLFGTWPKGVSAEVRLAHDAEGRPTHWQNRDLKDGPRPWYFSGPFYTEHPKFVLETRGYQPPDPRKPRRRVRVSIYDKDGKIPVVDHVLLPAYEPCAWFTGRWTSAAPALEKKYLHPNGSPYKVFISLADPAFQKGNPILWGAEFEVKSRIVFWHDEDPNPESDGYLKERIYVQLLLQQHPTLKMTLEPRDKEKLLVCPAAEGWRWADAYKSLTVGGTMYSIDHGSYFGEAGTGSYGRLELGKEKGKEKWAGFGAGVFEGQSVPREIRDTLRDAADGYPLDSYELPDVEIWLKHCWSADGSQWVWPWPPLRPGQGKSVADTLREIVGKGGGSGKVHGYKGPWVFTWKTDYQLTVQGVTEDQKRQLALFLVALEPKITAERLKKEFQGDLQRMTDAVRPEVISAVAAILQVDRVRAEQMVKFACIIAPEEAKTFETPKETTLQAQ